MPAVIINAELLQSINVTMPPSVRSKRHKSRRELFATQLKNALASFDFDPEQPYEIEGEFFGKWWTNDHKKILRTDLANLLGFTSDDVAAAAKIDDKCWFDIAMRKIDVGPMEKETCRIKIYKRLPP